MFWAAPHPRAPTCSGRPPLASVLGSVVPVFQFLVACVSQAPGFPLSFHLTGERLGLRVQAARAPLRPTDAQ